MDTQQLLFGEQEPWFLLEILIRTTTMFLVLVAGLRLLGKRGVRQLTVFELVVIIGLGSAAGDPMFYQEVGIISAMAVFAAIIACYRLTTYLIGKSPKIERLIEGKTVCLIQNGAFCIDSFNKEDLAQDEFFAELRIKGISQLGQVDRAYLEISGELSVFFFEDDQVKPGLPILPHQYDDQKQTVSDSGIYACAHCGATKQLKEKQRAVCSVCQKDKWVKASEQLRVK